MNLSYSILRPWEDAYPSADQKHRKEWRWWLHLAVQPLSQRLSRSGILLFNSGIDWLLFSAAQIDVYALSLQKRWFPTLDPPLFLEQLNWSDWGIFSIVCMDLFLCSTLIRRFCSFKKPFRSSVIPPNYQRPVFGKVEAGVRPHPLLA